MTDVVTIRFPEAPSIVLHRRLEAMLREQARHTLELAEPRLSNATRQQLCQRIRYLDLSIARCRSYAGFWVMGDQAARFAGASMTSMPSWNLTPPMTFGN
jgi:hypothetical protein